MISQEVMKLHYPNNKIQVVNKKLSVFVDMIDTESTNGELMLHFAHCGDIC